MASIVLIKHIADALKDIKDLAGIFAQAFRNKRAEERKAIESILLAATQTRAYLADVKSGMQVSREKERALSELWMKAHNAVWRIDMDLAEKCLIKADCWSDPRLWKDPRYRHIPLDLNTIVDSYSALARDLAPRRAKRSNKLKAVSSVQREKNALSKQARSTTAGILHLIVKREYFNRIVSGKKKIEYRRYNPYWKKRLEGKAFKEVLFRNGRSENAPTARVEFKDLTMRKFMGTTHYAIRLGKVLDVKDST